MSKELVKCLVTRRSFLSCSERDRSPGFAGHCKIEILEVSIDDQIAWIPVSGSKIDVMCVHKDLLRSLLKPQYLSAEKGRMPKCAHFPTTGWDEMGGLGSRCDM
jgi:hypothetical protein